MKRNGFQRLAVPAAFAPFAEGGFPTPSGKCEFHSAALAREGHETFDVAGLQVDVLGLGLAGGAAAAQSAETTRLFVKAQERYDAARKPEEFLAAAALYARILETMPVLKELLGV